MKPISDSVAGLFCYVVLNMSPPMSSQQLPPKEQALFKRIVKCYEQKQFRNGLKFTKQILSNPNFAEHGETLSMKGLILNCIGKKEEALELVKKGLRNDVRSHVCWHVYGLMQRSERKYDEAIKAFRNALKIDKENIQILRDLSMLQLQMRDLEGFKETRYHLFKLRPTQRVSWIGFALSLHLTEDYELAIRVLEDFRKTQNIEAYDIESSEFLLYQNMVYREAGKFEIALYHLESNKDHIYDRRSYLELKGELLMKLGRNLEASHVYHQLLARNEDNLDYYNLLEECLNLKTDDDVQDMEAVRRRLYLYDEVIKCYPNALAPHRLSLSFLPETEIEAPCTLLWLYYYLALHFDYLNKVDNALMYVNKGIEHTPTLVELYMHAGNMVEAAHWIEEAQSLDTADRYINSKCAKYMLQAGRIEDGIFMCSKFIREGLSSVESFSEMQYMWFEIECARAYRKAGQYGESLKKCHEVERHFSDIIDDQYDFHNYCIRRVTICSYIQLLRLEDRLREHQFFFRAAKCALKKKQAAKAEQQRLNKMKSNTKSKQDGIVDECKRQPQISAEKLASTSQPLEDALVFLRPLIQLNCTYPQAYFLGFEVYYRKMQDNQSSIDVVHEVTGEVFPERDAILDLFDYNAQYLQAYHNSIRHRLAVAEVMYFLNREKQAEAVEVAIKVENSMQDVNWKVCRKVLHRLSNRALFGVVDPTIIENYKVACRKRFPHAAAFFDQSLSSTLLANHVSSSSDHDNASDVNDVTEGLYDLSLP
ncbi:N-alpha-acetyltransferase 16, NatA auxiliary subunit [Trichinella pseudospiralis]|uniref:N-alpha-acetyltransferase 16, NatA auxiliary subunit n=1 Tax=Trichinella pseudospiralis TaxID=6337 RepID=A0A0V1G377_TRIPS|nr:N-alpha-acetyltransferase 16, NatA auxiliary subunit [Trichinella pseudospiralis]